MARFLLFVFALIVLARKFRLVQCADECKTHADCKLKYWPKYCCGGYVNWVSRDRTCTYGWCLDRYCSNDNDCGSPSLRCRSNKCINIGFSGCTKNTDCPTSNVCCKKTFPSDQTVCAVNCINSTCNSNDDCAGQGECCRSGRCTDKRCDEKCTADSECDLNQYCCKWKRTYWSSDNCAKTCVGEMCRIDRDCGARNECCISGKCVDRGCSGCIANSNCSTGHYCCKKGQWNELSECSENCIGKSCSTNDDCGGPDETCDSNYKCAVQQNSSPSQQNSSPSQQNSSTSSSSFPPWLIAVLTVSLFLFFIAVGILVGVIWYHQKKRPANAPQSGSVALQNTQYQGTQAQNRQAVAADVSNPTSYQHHLLRGNKDVAHPSQHPSTAHRGGFQNGPSAPNQSLTSQNPTQQTYENSEFHFNPSHTHNQQGHTNDHQYNNQLHDQVYHTLESPDAAHGTHYGQQMYPQNFPHQHNEYPHNPSHNPPPYNPHYQGNP